jgi:hypothetical protein
MTREEIMQDFTYADLERIALGFVLESETWPVFLAWCKTNANSEAIRMWVKMQPDLEAIRLQYMAHSPDPLIKALAGLEEIGGH